MSTAFAISSLVAQGTGSLSGGSSRPIDVRPADPDAALVTAAKNGDRSAFEELVNRHERAIFRLAQNITHATADAEEVLQETFLQVYRHLGRFQGGSRFSTWLTRIAINQALMLLRKRSNKVVSLDAPVERHEEFLPREIADWGPTPEQRYSTTELREILADTLSRLSPALRVVFQLRDVEELSTEETARVLGLSCSAVKSRLLRARFWLRERLNHFFASRRDDVDHDPGAGMGALSSGGLVVGG
jgi:RNA polymerase sigma-70 factor (ECF subfamily)